MDSSKPVEPKPSKPGKSAGKENPKTEAKKQVRRSNRKKGGKKVDLHLLHLCAFMGLCVYIICQANEKKEGKKLTSKKPAIKKPTAKRSVANSIRCGYALSRCSRFHFGSNLICAEIL